MTDPADLLGMSKNSAISLIENNGDLWRIRSEDGVETLVEDPTTNYADNRFNLHILSGDVIGVDVF